MEGHRLIEKLKNETNISYEEAKVALERSNWDILEAVIYLEKTEKIKRPSINIFYTNEYKENYNQGITVNKMNRENNHHNARNNNTFEGVFVKVCKIIDICNNIFFEIKKGNKVFLRIPVTVIILLLIFAFGVVIPLYIIGLFFELEFALSGNRIEINKINNALKVISEKVKDIKGKLKRRFKNG